MPVDDDRVYPRDALETYLDYSELLPAAALCYRGAAMLRSLDWRDVKLHTQAFVGLMPTD